MYTRLSKVVLVWAVAFFALLVVFNNVTDYESNYTFVAHVLKMDTTFPGNTGMWRAIEAPWAHHLVYGLIILIEAIIAALCCYGGFYLFKARRNPELFNRSKRFAISGLTVGILLWFTGIIAIGGEWFLMWQSQVANSQQAAFRLVMILTAILIYLVQPDDDRGA
ncbi:Predicted small integral membrane protein [Nitrosomonas marina]|uniref:Predicted small integral membrane protein n=1 Tax=Nitrosomonas marina TaxID=917 RepID=A0A1I0BPM4_9PROT|nr:DUF2165 domain-containing protein [Nitrosomonas marina]SET08986.1 Predicted small integral membrane protein [Nitrosomonas marina]